MDANKYPELNQKVSDLIEGKGSDISRQLTLQTLKSFPSTIQLVNPEYHQRLQELLSKEN
jgi:hypothetical protein